jgi:excisionase family DNA binding protein
MASGHERPRIRGSTKETAKMEPVTVTVDDAKRAIGIGTTKLYELINDGKLATVKIGRRTLIKTDSIRALIAA